MGTSNSNTLRQLALIREMTGETLVNIAADARDAKMYSEIIVHELMPEALPPVEPAPEPAPDESEPPNA